MTLIQKFQQISEIVKIEMPGMEVNKKYPILFADQNFHSVFGFLVTLILGLSGTSIAAIPLPAKYSQAFTQEDIAEINSQQGMYRLIYRKKETSSNYYYFEIVK
jgi:hypothetical protein